MRKTFLKIILLQFTLLYSDTTIVAFDAVHQYFGSLGNKRTVIDTIQFPDSNTGYSDITMHLNLECPTGGCDPWDLSPIHTRTFRRTQLCRSRWAPVPKKKNNVER